MSVQLSEQELIDCNTDGMNCADGGWPTMAYDYVIKKGLASSADYEFVGYTNECANDRTNRSTHINNTCECKFFQGLDKCCGSYKFSFFSVDMGGDEKGMKWLVYNYGPVVVVLYATLAFTEYTSGVYYEPPSACSTFAANHAVVKQLT